MTEIVADNNGQPLRKGNTQHLRECILAAKTLILCAMEVFTKKKTINLCAKETLYLCVRETLNVCVKESVRQNDQPLRDRDSFRYYFRRMQKTIVSGVFQYR